MLATQSEDKIPELSLYVGLAKVSVFAVNPTISELLEAKVITPEKAEEIRRIPLTNPDPQTGKYRVEFWLKLEEPTVDGVKLVRHSCYIKNEWATPSSRTKAIQVRNEKQQFTWMSESDFEANTPQWTKDGKSVYFEGTYSRAYTGERELYEILRIIAGVKKQELIPELNIAEICAGNERSIGRIIAGKPSTFYVLLGVSINAEGKLFQHVWKEPLPWWAKTNVQKLTALHKEVLETMKASQKIYVYALGPTFSLREMAFRKITAQQVYELAENDPSQHPSTSIYVTGSTPVNGYTPSPEVRMPDIAEILPIATPVADGGDDDLPF